MLFDSLTARAGSICPPNQDFYTCDANKFFGCCSIDPCALSGCPDDGDEDSPPPSSDPPSESNMNDPKTGGVPEPPTTAKPPVPTTRTDSGITHTIKNSEVVTITKHTVITTGYPPSSSTTSTSPTSTSTLTTSSSTITSVPAPAASGSNGTSSAGSSGSAVSSGTLIGAGVGGAIALAAIVAFIVFMMKRRRKNRSSSSTTAEPSEGPVKTDPYDEKHFPFPPPMSAHTTGTQEDPFAPFGGRVDQSEEPHQAPSGTFEMDATGSAPVELPAISINPAQTRYEGEEPLTPSITVRTASSSVITDPRANLHALKNDKGQPAYVNHWNQYKALGGG